MITKKDYEIALKQYEGMLVNATINIEANKLMIKACEDKIKEFPDDDPMPEEVKDIVDSIK